MFNALPATKEKFLKLKDLPLNQKVSILPDHKIKTLAIEMNKVTQTLVELINKIDYESVKEVSMSDEFLEYKKLPTLEHIKVDGPTLNNALIVIEGNKKAIERLNTYKDIVTKMYEEYPLISEYVSLNTELLILNHNGSILGAQKYINDNH